ncbi:LytTR family DNA-binding domain-containing protein [Azospirillum sp. TSO22-1]|uniref:LytTR family DNA-binding domain-containing protein n=1 Tax=Azospirillum sp. TSO22-1 TaxID=716789 RepID=UPI0011B8516F|nr:LytTR family DNA-binding domain-containing protein [Azospirillum sp. TSO22-1]
MRERSFLISLRRQAVVAVLLGVVLGVLGPFGSFEHVPAYVRVPLWTVLVAGNWLLVVLLGEALCRIPATAAWPAPVLAALAGVAGAVPGSLVSYRAAQALGPFERVMPSPLVFFGYVALLSVAISVPAALVFGRGRGEPAPSPAPESPEGTTPPSDSPFLARIPPHLGRELLAVETEDHYLRVHTPAGSDLLLMRMRDAVAELAPLDGLRVHRSWWVARTAVERAARSGTGLTLTLRGGLTVPVARAQRRTVREWLGA